MSESYIYYRSFYNALQELKPGDRSKVRDAIDAYVFDGKEPKLQGLCNMAWVLIKPQLDANIRRRDNGSKGAGFGKLGGRPKKGNPDVDTEKNPIGVNDKNPIGVSDKSPEKTPNVNVNDNANVNDKENVKEKASRRFAPPTIDEVRAYCLERGNTVDPERFVDFYAAKGWKVGNTPMKDWKACVRTWERPKNDPKPKTASQTNFISGGLSDDLLDSIEKRSIKKMQSNPVVDMHGQEVPSARA